MLKYFTSRLNWGVLFLTFPLFLPAQLIEQFSLTPPIANDQKISQYANVLSIQESNVGFYVLTKKSGCFLINQQQSASIETILEPNDRRDHFLDLVAVNTDVTLWANGHEIIPLDEISAERLPYSSNYFSETVQTNSISIDKHGTVYVGTEKDGLFIFHQDEWGNYTELSRRVSTFNQELPSNHVNCIYKDKNETIWVGTDAGLASIKEGIVKNLSLSDQKPLSWWDRFLGRDPKPPLFGEKVEAITSWGNCLLMLNEDGLYKVSVVDETIKHLVFYDFTDRLSTPLMDCNDMIVDIDSNIWIAANHLLHYDIARDKLTEVNALHSFKGQGFLSLAEDIVNNKILIGTKRGGLYQLNYQDIGLGVNW